MNDIVEEWVSKADADHDTARRELRVRKNTNCDAVCFHSQQCVEKYLKALLTSRQSPFQKTHDLEALLDKCLIFFPLLECFRKGLKLLSRYAVQFRYPGETADKQEAREAVRIMRECRNELRNALSLPTANGHPKRVRHTRSRRVPR